MVLSHLLHLILSLSCSLLLIPLQCFENHVQVHCILWAISLPSINTVLFERQGAMKHSSVLSSGWVQTKEGCIEAIMMMISESRMSTLDGNHQCGLHLLELHIVISNKKMWPLLYENNYSMLWLDGRNEEWDITMMCYCIISWIWRTGAHEQRHFLRQSAFFSMYCNLLIVK